MQKRVRSRAKRPQSTTKRPKISGGVIPWASLTEAQRVKFERHFQADNARFARSHATFEKKDSARVYMATYLETYQKLQCKVASLHEREAEVCRIGLKSKSSDVIGTAKNTLNELTAFRLDVTEMMHSYRQYIESLMFLWLRGGDWSAFQWLADYGREHAPEGLGSTTSGKFPAPKKKHAVESKNASMQMLVVGNFVRLSGMDYHDLHFPTYEPAPAPSTTLERIGQLDQPHGRMLPRCRPKSLPTKHHLHAIVTKAWNGLHDQKKTTKQAAPYFSRILKSLGLAGLPDSRSYRDDAPRRASKAKPEKLSEEGSELLAAMREGIR